MIHDDRCERSGKWYKRRDCQEFSTDGTDLGAVIAHQFGTTDEQQILRMGDDMRRKEIEAKLTGMPEEQADWEEDDEW